MKKSLLFTLAAAAAALVAAPQAQARDRCGAGWHRNAHGRCVLNNRARRPVLVIGRYYPGHGWWDGRRYNRHRALVIGRYYNGRGWWDGRRYYRHRYMHGRHWRYR